MWQPVNLPPLPQLPWRKCHLSNMPGTAATRKDPDIAQGGSSRVQTWLEKKLGRGERQDSPSTERWEWGSESQLRWHILWRGEKTNREQHHTYPVGHYLSRELGWVGDSVIPQLGVVQEKLADAMSVLSVGDPFRVLPGADAQVR
ncbi:UNVERIFIED_CONTAM: hypothetical protein K2H54_036158 [Gekko kuhli]